MRRDILLFLLLIGSLLAASLVSVFIRPYQRTEPIPQAASAPSSSHALIDDTRPGWVSLGPSDFVEVNGTPDTWRWEGSVLHSTGEPIGVFRTRDTFINFEMVIEWQHLKSGGNSGMFAWVPITALDTLVAGELPRQGIEVQMLDHGYAEQYEARTGEKADWFSTNGDIFPVGESQR